jgi:hypothetical protein
MRMGVARQQVSCDALTDGDASVASIRDVIPDLRPYCLFPISYVGTQRLFTRSLTLLGKVLFGQLLNELRVVKNNRCLLLLRLLRDILGTTATTQIGARLFRLTHRLVDDMPLKNTSGLHASNPREDIQDLFIALEDDLPVETQFVHGENDEAGRSYAISAGQVAEKAITQRACAALRLAGGVHLQMLWRRDCRSYGLEVKERLEPGVRRPTNSV